MDTVFFVTLDIIEKASGVELSALARSKLFEEFLNIEPVMITSCFNSVLHKNLSRAKRNSRAASNLRVLNMYDYFQEVTHINFPSNIKFRDNFDPFQTIPVPDNNRDLRLYDDKGGFAAYCVRHEDLSVSFINYLENDYVCRRETYDCRGFLSRIELLEQKTDTEQVAHEVYFRIDGSIAITKRCLINNNLSSAYSVHLIDKKGQVVKMFNNDPDLLNYWLGLVANEFPDSTFIIDRCAEFFEPLKKAKDTVSGNIKLIPVIHSVHTHDDPLVGKSSPFYKTTIEDTTSSDAIIVFTEAQKNDLSRRYRHTNVMVIPHGYDVASEIPPLSGRNRYDVVYLARFAPEKNHNLAIDMFRLVVDKVADAKLHCYGFGEKRAEILEKIATLNLQDNVFVHDFVDDIEFIYKNAGLSILTSNIESQCMSVLESLCCGCPVVSFDIKYGPSAMIKQGVNGFLIPYPNTTDFAKCLIGILNDPILHESLVKNSSPSMVPFTSKELSKKWSRLFEYLKLPKEKRQPTITYPVC